MRTSPFRSPALRAISSGRANTPTNRISIMPVKGAQVARLTIVRYLIPCFVYLWAGWLSVYRRPIKASVGGRRGVESCRYLLSRGLNTRQHLLLIFSLCTELTIGTSNAQSTYHQLHDRASPVECSSRPSPAQYIAIDSHTEIRTPCLIADENTVSPHLTGQLQPLLLRQRNLLIL